MENSGKNNIRTKWLALLLALTLAIACAACGGDISPESYNRESDLPPETTQLLLSSMGYDKREKAYYVVAQAMGGSGGTYTLLGDEMYTFPLEEGAFNADMWEPGVDGARSTQRYQGASDFYSQYYSLARSRNDGVFTPVRCGYYFENGSLAALSEEYYDLDIDITTGEPGDHGEDGQDS